MTIQFCPTCKNMQIIITKDSKQYLLCNSCQTEEPCETKERIIQTETITKVGMGIGMTKKNFSDYNFKCKECDNKEYKLIDLGIALGDENRSCLLQCTKCDYSEKADERF